MSAFNYYSISIVLLSVSFGAIMIIAPGNEKIKKSLRFVCAVCMAASLIFPVRKILGINIELNFEKLSDQSIEYDYEYEKQISDKLCSMIEEEAINTVRNRFGVECDRCDVLINTKDYSAIFIEYVTVVPKTKSDFLREDIRKYLEEKLECKVKTEKWIG